MKKIFFCISHLALSLRKKNQVMIFKTESLINNDCSHSKMSSQFWGTVVTRHILGLGIFLQ